MKQQIKIRGTIRRNPRSPSERKRIEAARAYFKQKKPSLNRLLRTGEVQSAMPWGDYLALQEVFKALQSIRRKKAISLSALARKTGIDKAALSRLENGAQKNPTVSTICRCAEALGATVRIVLETPGGTA